jgi:hypothetical protein
MSDDISLALARALLCRKTDMESRVNERCERVGKENEKTSQRMTTRRERETVEVKPRYYQ